MDELHLVLNVFREWINAQYVIDERICHLSQTEPTFYLFDFRILSNRFACNIHATYITIYRLGLESNTYNWADPECFDKIKDFIDSVL